MDIKRTAKTLSAWELLALEKGLEALDILGSADQDSLKALQHKLKDCYKVRLHYLNFSE